MGGIIGLTLSPYVPHMRTLILNDIGPYLYKDPINGIVDKVKLMSSVRFSGLDEAATFFKTNYAAVGKDVTEEQWLGMARHSTMPDGEKTLKV